MLTHLVPGRASGLLDGTDLSWHGRGVWRVSSLWTRWFKYKETQPPWSATSPQLANQMHLFPCREMEALQCFSIEGFFFPNWNVQPREVKSPASTDGRILRGLDRNCLWHYDLIKWLAMGVTPPTSSPELCALPLRQTPTEDEGCLLLICSSTGISWCSLLLWGPGFSLVVVMTGRKRLTLFGSCNFSFI